MFEVISDDKELNMINVMLQTMQRYLDGETTVESSKSEFDARKKVMLRSIKYVLERIENLE